MRKLYDTGRESQVAVASRLHTLRSTHEGEVLAEYLEFQLARLAEQALSCTPDQLNKIQGKAEQCREALRDLHDGPNIVNTDQ